MNNKLNQRHLIQKKFKYVSKDQRQVILKQLEDIDTIYFLNEAISNRKSKNKEGDMSPYFRSILEAIYIRTKKQSIHEFIGIVTDINTNLKDNANIVRIYLSNVFWNTVYVSHHIVIDKDKKYFNLNPVRSGDFIRFKSIIEEYEDGSNYGLKDFDMCERLPTLLWIGPVKAKYSNVSCDYKSAVSGLRYVLENKNYKDAHKLYTDLMWNSTNFHIYTDNINNIPYNYYNTMIHSLYYRQQWEKVLYDRILQIVPPVNDITDLIMIQLFVAWMVTERKMINPSFVFFSTVKFIKYVTSNSLSDICNNSDFKLDINEMKHCNNTIFNNFMRIGETDNIGDQYFAAGNLKEFSDFYVSLLLKK